MLAAEGYKHPPRICNTYRFVTATMVTRTRHIATRIRTVPRLFNVFTATFRIWKRLSIHNMTSHLAVEKSDPRNHKTIPKFGPKRKTWNVFLRRPASFFFFFFFLYFCFCQNFFIVSAWPHIAPTIQVFNQWAEYSCVYWQNNFYFLH